MLLIEAFFYFASPFRFVGGHSAWNNTKKRVIPLPTSHIQKSILIVITSAVSTLLYDDSRVEI